MSFYSKNSNKLSSSSNKDDEAKSLNNNNNNNNNFTNNFTNISNESRSPSFNNINDDQFKKLGQTDSAQFNEIGEYVLLPYLEPKRWLILTVFGMIYLINFFQLTQYGDLQIALIQFYNISMPSNNLKQYDAANWLSVIHMITNLVFIFPAMFLLDYKGLKLSCLIAISLTTVGSWIKCASVRSDLYGVLLTGQVICGIAQAFIQSCLTKMPALWFGKYEVATATSIGLISGRIGCLLGFLIPPYLILHKESNLINTEYLFLMYLSSSFLSTITLVCTFFAIKNYPQRAPSHAQIELRKKTWHCDRKFRAKTVGFIKSLVEIVRNRNFICVVFSNGIISGAHYSLNALLNQILYQYYPNENVKVGFIVLFFILSSVFGLLIFGLILDHTRSYKFIIIFVYSFTLFFTTLFWTTTQLDIWYPFFTLLSLGFFLNAYQPVGYEIAVELTFPISESISCGILNAFSIAFGIILIYSQGFITNNYGAFYSSFYLTAFILIGLLVTIVIKKDFKRQNVYDIVEKNNQSLHKMNKSKSNSYSSLN